MSDVNIVVWGQANSGKSKLVKRLLTNKYEEQSESEPSNQHYKLNVKYDNTFRENYSNVPEASGLDIWDITQLESIFLRNADIVLFCVDLTQEIDKSAIQQQIKILKNNCLATYVFLVGTKADDPNADETKLKSIAEMVHFSATTIISAKTEAGIEALKSSIIEACCFTLAQSKEIKIEKEHYRKEKEEDNEAKQDEVKQDEVKQDEVKQDEAKQDEVKQDEVKQDEVKQDEAKQDEVKQDEVKQDEVADNKQDEPLDQAINKLLDSLGETPAKQGIQNALNVMCTALKTSLTSSQDQVIQVFITECKSILGETHPLLKAVYTVATTAAVIVLAGTIGFTVGFALSWWTGPGAFFTSLAAGYTAAASVAASSVALGGLAGSIKAYSLFKPSKEMTAINAFVEEITPLAVTA